MQMISFIAMVHSLLVMFPFESAHVRFLRITAASLKIPTDSCLAIFFLAFRSSSGVGSWSNVMYAPYCT